MVMFMLSRVKQRTNSYLKESHTCDGAVFPSVYSVDAQCGYMKILRFKFSFALLINHVNLC